MPFFLSLICTEVVPNGCFVRSKEVTTNNKGAPTEERGSTATAANGNTTVKVELRDDGVVALEFTYRGSRGPVQVEIDGLVLAAAAKNTDDLEIRMHARERRRN